jgi:primosomal protein N' (replication factor Y) (superfamily II helicase)
MQYVEILPLVTTGAGDTAFTYESETPLAIGSLVMIPLRNRQVKGFVTKIALKPKFPTKPVSKILTEEPVLSENHLEVAHRIADYYLSTTSDVISCMLPFDFGKRRQVGKTPKLADFKIQSDLKLTKDQKKAFETIKAGAAGSKYLLFGVTGSGKTEVYLQLAAEAVKKGQSVIILIPEISLTPQTQERFEQRFGNQVAVWHSELKETEKFHTWQRIKSGEAKVVLGARSAIFAPISNLGYIFIDEEHESSYKQDQNPRYDASRVAEWLCELTGAKLVLGSATPRIESYHRAQKGEITLCSLEQRIVQEGMPPVKIVDLRDEFKKGNKSIFSDALAEAVQKALADKKQVLLFVNRRGASTFVVCRDCGAVLECPHCEIPLTYHPSEGEALNCHHCGYTRAAPSVCPNCESHAIKYFGLGTQRVEIEAKRLFPDAKVARMDRDTTQKRGSHAQIYNDFKDKESDILVGTQIVAKGWDLPNVSVVGVISADTMLNLPDFRSAERTFGLLTQVAGRTGRGFHPGEVFVQTYSPENYAILAASEHDFCLFFEREIKERENYGFPPFSDLIKLTYSGKSDMESAKKAQDLAESLKKQVGDSKDITILGPNPSFLPKLAGKFRYQIVVKITNDKLQMTNQSQISKSNLKIKDTLVESIRAGWTVDIDPDNLL